HGGTRASQHTTGNVGRMRGESAASSSRSRTTWLSAACSALSEKRRRRLALGEDGRVVVAGGDRRRDRSPLCGPVRAPRAPGRIVAVKPSPRGGGRRGRRARGASDYS